MDGPGGPQSATISVPLRIEDVNDAPSVVLPAAPIVVNEDAAVPLGLAVFDQDVDETPGGEVEVEVWTGHAGRLEVQSVTTRVTRVNQVQTVVVSVPWPSVRPLGYIPSLSGSYKLGLDLGELTGDSTLGIVTVNLDGNAVAKVHGCE